MHEPKTSLAEVLAKHRYDASSQDSGQHCTCGSDSRYDQRNGDGEWSTFSEHHEAMAKNWFVAWLQSDATLEEVARTVTCRQEADVVVAGLVVRLLGKPSR